MEKWENVSSPVRLNPHPPFFKAAFVNIFFYKLKSNEELSKKRRWASSATRRPGAMTEILSLGGHVLWPNRQNVGLSSNNRIYCRYQEVWQGGTCRSLNKEVDEKNGYSNIE